jgi:hypothetical protein
MIDCLRLPTARATSAADSRSACFGSTRTALDKTLARAIRDLLISATTVTDFQRIFYACRSGSESGAGASWIILWTLGAKSGQVRKTPLLRVVDQRAPTPLRQFAAVRPSGEAPHGTSLLPADLTDDQLDAAPVLDSIDSLLIEELSEDEDDAFAAALES